MLAAHGRGLFRAASQTGALAAALQRLSTSVPAWGVSGKGLGQEGPWGAKGLGLWRDKEDREPLPDRKLHTAGALLRAATGNVPPGQSGSIFNDPDATAREAGSTTGGGEGGASTSYLLLSAAHAGLAATAFFAPTFMVNTFFPGAALPQGMQLQVLSKILACGLGTGSATCLALKQAADSGDLASPTAQRLQLGLMGFSSGAIALHLLYSPSLSPLSLVMGAAVMGSTFAAPYAHYKRSQGSLGLGQVLKRYFGAVPDHLNITGLQSGLYSLITPTLALAGASYLFMPTDSLGFVFGYSRGIESLFLWQTVGGALMTVAPAVTYSLKKAADEGSLHQPLYKTLNAGVALAAAGHLAVLYPMISAGQGGPLLPWVAGAWGSALLASGMGLMKGGAAKAATV